MEVSQAHPLQSQQPSAVANELRAAALPRSCDRRLIAPFGVVIPRTPPPAPDPSSPNCGSAEQRASVWTGLRVVAPGVLVQYHRNPREVSVHLVPPADAERLPPRARLALIDRIIEIASTSSELSKELMGRTVVAHTKSAPALRVLFSCLESLCANHGAPLPTGAIKDLQKTIRDRTDIDPAHPIVVENAFLKISLTSAPPSLMLRFSYKLNELRGNYPAGGAWYQVRAEIRDRLSTSAKSDEHDSSSATVHGVSKAWLNGFTGKYLIPVSTIVAGGVLIASAPFFGSYTPLLIGAMTAAAGFGALYNAYRNISRITAQAADWFSRADRTNNQAPE